MDREKIKDLLDRYLTGKTSDEENHLIENWLEEQEEENQEWAAMAVLDREQWLAHVYTDLNIGLDEPKPVRLKAHSFFNWKTVGAIAAILIVALIFYAKWPGLIYKELQITEQTTNHNKKLIKLPDGSLVWLNSNSELRYPKIFSGNIREVYLSGEAYFDVKHDAKRTFIIRNGSFVTTVLGTAFNIKEDKIANTVQVTVTRGKVSVANSGKTLAFLTPNKQLNFNLSKKEATEKLVNTSKVIAWQNADFHFDDISFADATMQLAVHFGVKISFANNQLKKCHFTGTNLSGQKLEDILDVMCAFNKATYKIDEQGNVLIDGKGCN